MTRDPGTAAGNFDSIQVPAPTIIRIIISIIISIISSIILSIIVSIIISIIIIVMNAKTLINISTISLIDTSSPNGIEEALLSFDTTTEPL